MIAAGALATVLIGLVATPSHHEGTKASRLRDKALVMQTAPSPRTIDKGDRPGVQSPRQVVVRSEEEWSALWHEHAPSRQRPAVDFSREMVVGVFLGSKPTAAYSVAIVSTIEANGVLQVRYRLTEPAPGTITAQVITFPYHLAAVPKSSAKEVKFEKVP